MLLKVDLDTGPLYKTRPEKIIPVYVNLVYFSGYYCTTGHSDFELTTSIVKIQVNKGSKQHTSGQAGRKQNTHWFLHE